MSPTELKSAQQQGEEQAEDAAKDHAAQDKKKRVVSATTEKQPAYLRFPLPPRPVNEVGQLVRLHPLTKQWYCVKQSQPVEMPKRSSELPKLHPQVEILRAQKHNALKMQLESLCAAQGVPKGQPQGLFERWLWTQLCIQPEEADPLIPFSATHEEPRFEQELADFDVKEATCREILRQMADASRRFCQEIRDKATELASEQEQVPTIDISKHPNRRDALRVCYQSTMLDLNEEHYNKLKRNYHTNPREHSAEFKRDLFCLLLRYYTLGGDAYQAACPPFVFRHFRYELGVQQECFASPLNCYFSKLCSAFPDTDTAFGSVGSFFQFLPEEGSFEANPPFTEVTMQKMTEHIDYLLARTTKPLSFLVVVPRWDDAASPMWQMLSESPFMVRRVDVPKRSHQYCKGYQHNLASKYWIASHETCVFFLQNEAGREKYKVTDSLCDKLLAVWRMNNNKNPRNGRLEDRENRHRPRYSDEDRPFDSRDRNSSRRRRYADLRDNARHDYGDRRGKDRDDNRRKDRRDDSRDGRHGDRGGDRWDERRREHRGDRDDPCSIPSRHSGRRGYRR